MRFAERAGGDAERNELSLLGDELRAAGFVLADLTASNPTRAGFAYPEAEIARAIGAQDAFVYDPDPRGVRSAREAVSRGVYAGAVPADRLVLTASTSEAYAWLFKILCAPGDEVLVPAPSYPLLDFIAQAESVILRRYPLVHDDRWCLDPGALAAACGPRTRAVVVVQPNNPTGSFLTPEEIAELHEFCVRHDLAIISDEVFREYAFRDDGSVPLLGPDRGSAARWPSGPPAPSRSAAPVFPFLPVLPGSGPSLLPVDRVGPADGSLPPCALTFALGGLSKLAGLPQMKLAWIGVGGPGATCEAALERLELLGDTFLSVATPVQRGLAEILTATGPVRAAIRARTAQNLAWIRAQRHAEASWQLLDPEGGWYALLRLPRIHTDDGWARLFLAEDHVFVHPGSFFDAPQDGFVVLSLLPPEEEFSRAVGRLLDRVERCVRA